MHNYKFQFGNGTIFRTPASSYDEALSHFNHTFSPVEIQRRGGINIRIPKAAAPLLYSENDTFTTAEVCQIVGISPRTLTYWKENGLVKTAGRNKYNTKAVRDAFECKKGKIEDPLHYVRKLKRKKLMEEVQNG